MGFGTGTGLAAGLGGIAGALVVVVGLILAADSWVRMRNSIKDPADAAKKVMDSLARQGLLHEHATLEDIPADAAGWIQAFLQAILSLAKTASGYALAIMLIGTLLIVGSAWGTANSPAASPTPTASGAPVASPSPTP